MATGVLAPPSRPSRSVMTGRASSSVDRRLFCAARSREVRCSVVAHHVLLIIDSVNGINTIPANAAEIAPTSFTQSRR